MKKLLIQLLEKWACKHEWKTYQKCDVYNEFSRKIPSHLEFILMQEMWENKENKIIARLYLAILPKILTNFPCHQILLFQNHLLYVLFYFPCLFLQLLSSS